MDKELEEYLKKFNCRGCGNRCPLHDPGCGRSKVYINEALEKRNNNK